jgi:hypothetical protein
VAAATRTQRQYSDSKPTAALTCSWTVEPWLPSAFESAAKTNGKSVSIRKRADTFARYLSEKKLLVGGGQGGGLMPLFEVAARQSQGHDAERGGAAAAAAEGGGGGGGGCVQQQQGTDPMTASQSSGVSTRGHPAT